MHTFSRAFHAIFYAYTRKMSNKLIIILQIILVLILLCTPLSAKTVQGYLDVYFDCAGGCCVEGDNFTAYVALSAPNVALKVTVLKLVGKDGEKFASAHVGEVTIYAGKPQTFKLSGVLPKPSSGTGANAKLEFKFEYSSEGWKGESNDYLERTVIFRQDHKCSKSSDCSPEDYCSITNCISECKRVTLGTCGNVSDHVWVNYECCADSVCSENETCSGNKCTQVSCPCGNITNHTCIKYECCADNDCLSRDKCVNNKCTAIPCPCGMILNRTCIPYECCSDDACNTGEICENHTCSTGCHFDSACNEGYNCTNNQCTEIECICGYITNHTCMKYECCSNKDCESNKYCDRKHNCSDPECSPQQTVKNHKCEDNTVMGSGITLTAPVEVVALALAMVIIAIIIVVRRRRK